MLETTDNEIMSLDVMKKAMAAGGLLDIGKYGEASVKVTGAAPKKGLQRIDMWGASAAAGVFNVWQEFLGREENLKIPYSMLFKKGLFKLNLPDTDPETDAGSGTDDAQVGFLSPETNPIVRAFESTRGRGLAGVITQLDYSWLENTWTTGKEGSRAPKACTITISFSPMHDIAPGMDAYGMNRAPVYNVGNAVNNIGHDPYDD